MEFAPVIIAFSNIVTLALAASFVAGWYGGRNYHDRRRPNRSVTEEDANDSHSTLADLRVRIRHLEARAAGIDL